VKVGFVENVSFINWSSLKVQKWYHSCISWWQHSTVLAYIALWIIIIFYSHHSHNCIMVKTSMQKLYGLLSIFLLILTILIIVSWWKQACKSSMDYYQFFCSHNCIMVKTSMQKLLTSWWTWSSLKAAWALLLKQSNAAVLHNCLVKTSHQVMQRIYFSSISYMWNDIVQDDEDD